MPNIFLDHGGSNVDNFYRLETGQSLGDSVLRWGLKPEEETECLDLCK